MENCSILTSIACCCDANTPVMTAVSSTSRGATGHKCHKTENHFPLADSHGSYGFCAFIEIKVWSKSTLLLKVCPSHCCSFDVAFEHCIFLNLKVLKLRTEDLQAFQHISKLFTSFIWPCCFPEPRSWMMRAEWSWMICPYCGTYIAPFWCRASLSTTAELASFFPVRTRSFGFSGAADRNRTAPEPTCCLCFGFGSTLLIFLFKLPRERCCESARLVKQARTAKAVQL